MGLNNSIFGMAAMPFPCTGIWLIQGLTYGHSSGFSNEQEYYASLPIPFFHFFLFMEDGKAFNFKHIWNVLFS